MSKITDTNRMLTINATISRSSTTSAPGVLIGSFLA